MNHLEPRLDDLIDRIVDGALPPTQMREAVGRIGESNDGWRRLALAFLEAQALGQVLREMGEAQATAHEIIPIRRKAIAARRFAYAASLAVLAFGLGWIGHGSLKDKGQAPGATGGTPPLPIAQTRQTDRIQPVSPDARLGENLPGATGGTPPVLSTQMAHTLRVRPVPPEERPAIADSALGAGLTTPPEPTTEGLLAREEVGIPLADWLRDQPPPISSYEQAVLEREGYRVEQSREVVFGTLDDGRLAAVPVDQVQVEYVGHMPL